MVAICSVMVCLCAGAYQLERALSLNEIFLLIKFSGVYVHDDLPRVAELSTRLKNDQETL